MVKQLLFLILLSEVSLAQSDSANRAVANAEALIQSLQQPTFYSRTEAERFESNKAFIAAWDQIVSLPSALDHTFKLKEVSVLTSSSGQVRVITWNIPKEDGTHVFFGYVLVRTESKSGKPFHKKTVTEYHAHKLLDRSATVKSPEGYTGTADKWFGMLYTQLVDGEDYFTLIGWDGNNKLTQRKFVDVLWFKGDGTPVFGKDVFRIPKKNPRRLMFEYSSEVTMSVHYDEKSGSIIYSHLSSHKEGPMLEGQYQFYGPDGSYDALVRSRGKWEVEEDVDARNPKNKNDDAKKPDPDKQAPIYRPK